MTRADPPDQVVVITGGARGVGEMLARKLAARGARIALVGLEADRARRVAADLPTDSGAWHADVTDVQRMTAVADAVRDRFGRIDTVVANAGIGHGGPLGCADMEAWRRVVDVNLTGSAVTAHVFLPLLAESRGYFLQIASVVALAPAPLLTAYSASKAGAEALAHGLRAEVAHRGVGVGVAYLSWTETDMVRAADRYPALREMRRRMPWPAGRTYPLGPAVDRLVTGIERRAAHVYGQGWLRGLPPVRGCLPWLVGVAGAREMRRQQGAPPSGGGSGGGGPEAPAPAAR
ncbi:short-chain dehydrogenase [Streptomyces solincola]|uniref:Short-chain dehydrogenase n=1 Tax=Streptomyces solincola TaxID=2100817 RepID=A0A2S9PPL3_9ACTN|nr:SDR family oxidoreductase [Streptomyces solincola]PRH76287.1 short-chain dehydrogenase [Streptomyces solincola]